MNIAIAFCGLDCLSCEAYIATKNNDEIAKGEIVKKWSKDFGIPNLSPASISCIGCHSPSEPLCGHCLECEIRACGLKRGVNNCAYCPDFDACKILNTFLQNVPDAQRNLLNIRASF